ncbi:major capsid protein [Tortoise microvirus 33]|nr:major capsid protein [Tortoise microvirus 33]
MSVFSHVANRRPKRSAFNLSHEFKLSANMGQLVPILCQEVVPGDKFRGSSQALVRMAPMLAPIMHRLDVYIHYYFVPNRIIWDEWESFITKGATGLEAPVFPQFSFTGTDAADMLGHRSLADYLGIGLGGTPSDSATLNISQLPFRAYQLIYNEYYRDQTLSPEIPIPKTSGIIDSSDTSQILPLIALRQRAWEKDYFTSALPFAQRGPAVKIPLSGEGQVVLDPDLAPGSYQVLRKNDGSDFSALGSGSFSEIGRRNAIAQPDPALYDKVDGQPALIDPNGTLRTDLDQTGAGADINEFRRSFRLQEWLEKNARAGARYIEQIASHFGVRSSDARLQRPEFLGGGKSPIVISEVLQTSSTDTESPQANMAGHGLSATSVNSFSRYFEEHGYLIAIMSIRPRTCYQQGIPRHFLKFDTYDFYWPEFAHLGEQPIYNQEIYADTGDSSVNNEVFGYTPRYSEYKYMNSRVAGDFKDTLAFWHLGRIFDSRPTLSGQFIQTENIERIFAVDDTGETNKFWINVYHDLKAVRPMPYFGTPTI